MIKTLVLIGGFQAATIAVTVVRSKLISVTLGPEGLGVTGTIDQILSVVLQLSSLSLPAIAIRLLPRTHGVDPDGFRRQYANFIAAVLVTSGVGAAIVAGLVQTFPSLLGHELAAYRLPVVIALVSVPLMALGLLLPNVLSASQRQASGALLYFALAAASTAAAWIGIQIGGIREIYIVQAAALVVCLAVALGYMWRRCDLPFVGRSGALQAAAAGQPRSGVDGNSRLHRSARHCRGTARGAIGDADRQGRRDCRPAPGPAQHRTVRGRGTVGHERTLSRPAPEPAHGAGRQGRRRRAVSDAGN